MSSAFVKEEQQSGNVLDLSFKDVKAIVDNPQLGFTELITYYPSINNLKFAKSILNARPERFKGENKYYNELLDCHLEILKEKL